MFLAWISILLANMFKHVANIGFASDLMNEAYIYPINESLWDFFILFWSSDQRKS